MCAPNSFQSGSSRFYKCRMWETVLSEFCWPKTMWDSNKVVYSCCLLSANNKQIYYMEETRGLLNFPQRMHPISCRLSLFCTNCCTSNGTESISEQMCRSFMRGSFKIFDCCTAQTFVHQAHLFSLLSIHLYYMPPLQFSVHTWLVDLNEIWGRVRHSSLTMLSSSSCVTWRQSWGHVKSYVFQMAEQQEETHPRFWNHCLKESCPTKNNHFGIF